MLDYIGNILYDEQLYREQEIVIYGAGKIGKKIIIFLENNNCKENIVCVCDGNSKLWNRQVEGIDILSPPVAVKRYKEACFIVGGDYADEMVKYLIECGISKIHLLFMN